MKILNFGFYFVLLFLRAHSEYTAAVVEFYPEQERDLAPKERLEKNVNGYIKILYDISKTRGLDIIVYPEATLAANAKISNHRDVLPYSIDVQINGSSLCYSSIKSFVTPLSCAAIKYHTYIVVNLYEKAVCASSSKCHDDGLDFYNTNVVFDRTGVIISKYRKFNLFGENFITKPETVDMSIFHTDFNVTFGMFTCFDIVFRQPSIDLVTKHNITSIIFPTMWFSELPFLTSLQTQLMWAYALNVTLLASGANNLQVGSGGTGIYQGTSGAIVYTILGTNQSKSFTTKVPNKHTEDWPNETIIDEKAKKMDPFYFKTDRFSEYTSKLILQNQSKITEIVCSNGLCCNFNITVKWNTTILNDLNNHYQYYMVAYSGVKSFDNVYNGGIDICGIIACPTTSMESCGKRIPEYGTISWPVQFSKISITVEFDLGDNKTQFPNSLLSNFEPIPVSGIEWKSVTNDEKVRRTYNLIKPVNRLMTFAIYGRDFNRDSPVGTGSINKLSIFGLLPLFIMIINVNNCI